MRTAETRGFSSCRRRGSTSSGLLSCSWFKSRYPCKKDPRPDRGFFVDSAERAGPRGRRDRAFSYYDIRMDDGDETIEGVPVTEAQIDAWAAEAEAGYDIEELKRRGRGRPGRASEPTQVVALRLTADELASIDERAAREGKSRSEVIRAAISASPA